MTQADADVLNSEITLYYGQPSTVSQRCGITELNIDIGYYDTMTSLPSELKFLTNLDVLSLYAVDFTTIPADLSVLENLTNLITLDFYDSTFADFPDEIWSLT